MKKILLFAAIAAATMTSCSQTESVDQAKGKAIGFETYVGKTNKGVPVTGTAFADGATMAVYSTKDGVADMNNVTVTKADGKWTYSPVMFYVKNLPYIFSAFSPAPAPAGAAMGTVTDYTVDPDITKQVDFMYAPATNSVTWDGEAGTVMAPIQFAFKHALSQVKFSAKATVEVSDMYTVKITSFAIKDVNSKATLTVAGDSWSAATTPVDYAQTVADFTLGTTMAPLADADNHVLMLIPQTWTTGLEVIVALTVEAIVPGGGDATLNGDKSITARIPAGTWERNKIYNYSMSLDLSNILNLKEIAFEDPTIEDWTPEEVETPIVGQ